MNEFWYYNYEEVGIKKATKFFVERYSFRKKYYYDVLIESLGSLKGKTILDLGCNSGFWSLSAIKDGCDKVISIESRDKFTKQYEEVFKKYNVDENKYELIKGDFNEEILKFENSSFDIIFCFNVVHHINNLIPFLKELKRINKDILVIDTYLSILDGAVLELVEEEADHIFTIDETGLVTLPTRRFLSLVLAKIGYNTCYLPLREEIRNSSVEHYYTGKAGVFISSLIRKYGGEEIKSERMQWGSYV